VVLLEERPDAVLVYGDTNSTLAGALAAAKLNIPVAHVEAGLRSFNRRMPEEVNRVLTDHVSELLFAPTQAAVANLIREGVDRSRIHCVGDVMYDAALLFGDRAVASSRVLERLGLEGGEYILATAHRAENTNDPVRLEAIFRGLCDIAREMAVVLPLHPRTRGALCSVGLDLEAAPPGLRLTEPFGYLDMVMLEKNARLIVTDSGGVQKEAFFFGVPCVTLREETEWVELVELGWNRLAPPSHSGQVVEAIRAALRITPSAVSSPYGEGDSSSRIASILTQHTPPRSGRIA
jgi:UDP-GlcNAc3NAcA epimerase